MADSTAVTLWQRIARDSDIPKEDRILGHEFESALQLYLNNHATRTQMINLFNFTTLQIETLDAFKSYFDALPNAIAKVAYFLDTISCVTLLQLGKMTKGQIKTILGF